MSELDSFESLPDLNPGLLEPVPVSGRRPRRYKLAWVLMGVLLIVGIAPVITLSSRLIERNKEALKTQQQVAQHGLASSLSHHLDSVVDGQQRMLKALAEVLSERARSSGDANLRQDLARRRTLSRFVDKDLVMLRYTHRDGSWVNAKQEGVEIEEGVEALLAAEFAGQMNTGRHAQVMIGRPFYAALLRGPAVVLSVPVTREDRRVGVLTALATFKTVWREAERSSSAYTVFALTRDGELITEPPASGVLAGGAYRDLEVVEEFIDSGGNRVMPYTVDDGTGETVTLIGAYDTTRRGWGIFVQADENQAYSEVASMKSDTRFYGVVAAIGAVALGLLFAGWVSRPVRWLADSSLAFAEGDFTARVTVRSRNEIGELAETFNVMAETLQKYIARLKRAAIETSELFLGSVKALAAAIDEKDAYTHGHSARVRMYSTALARALDLPTSEVWKVEIGALLHDVGKIGIEDRILNKPGPLAEDEYEQMKTHPVRGANIMGPIRQLRDVIPCMKYHHERWDGAGYPEGLCGEDIPLGARVVTVADCFDAMTTNRPYQRAMEMDEAIERLRQLAGMVFDVTLVEEFIGVLERGEVTAVYDQARQQVRRTEAHVAEVQAASGVLDHIDPDCLPPEARR